MTSPDGKHPRGTRIACDYYLAIGDGTVYKSFTDLDNPSTIEQLIGRVEHYDTSNFIVDFSEDAAWAGFDLSCKSVQSLFDSERPGSLSTRWINLSYPFEERPLISLLAKRYDFSPRLLALMCSDPRLPRSSTSRSTLPRSIKHHYWSTSESKDAEAAELDEISEHSSASSVDSVTRGNLYKTADNIWHYSSIDFGRQYVCIGFNSLYGTKRPHCADDDDSGSYIPHCTRVWTWLILCEDQTVISINEDVFPFTQRDYSAFQLQVLAQTRRNLASVFRSLSTVQNEPLLAHNPLTLLPLRTRLGNTPEETAHRHSDAPGLLFYYLFENWHNSYTLVTRKESRYGIELNKLRVEMFRQPKLGHIGRLDEIGKELGVLKKHYSSYDRIIDRLLEPQTASAASLHNSQVVTSSSQASLDTVRPVVTEEVSLMGVSLSSAARVRFKRLRDVIDLYALSEVEEYISQKDALVAMNFNLIAIKQSVDVERLTRITLLLTQASILFLPVSLMTSYFSMQLVGVDYTVRTYWVGFVVCFFLSWLALFVFGLFHGTVQTIEVFRSTWRGIQWLGRSFGRS
ncbi:hypothetical protein DOTSEDRAFT_58763 [Dothistroma septosporum NZE10]|uniref:Uncharacterized protein n=1 Tax=Dothistroma septosporum (strain NZE10 / CBS 128990) TaxID=675120 RepID=N1Q2T8_DOTSN|nr:hypothetical protein DOTSEDRAFT_58763 [Dothistroma septosporum NZE10]